MVLNVVARRRSSGGPESTTARMSRSPSASRPAAVSSPASGLLTHRARPKASRAAPIMAITAIVPRMTQSRITSSFSELVDLARITVPHQPVLAAQEDGHGGGDPRPGDLGDRLHRLARLLRELTLLLGLGGQPDPVTGRHALVDQPVAVPRVAHEDQQAVAGLRRLGDQDDQGSVRRRTAVGRTARSGLGESIQPRLGDRGVGARHARGGLDEGRPVVGGRVERQRHHRADQHRGGEGQQDQQDPPGHDVPA